jgi:hypothetical protein
MKTEQKFLEKYINYATKVTRLVYTPEDNFYLIVRNKYLLVHI